MNTRASLLILLIVGWLVSAAVKLSLSYAIIFDYDIVPVVQLGWNWLHGGAFPVYGTLSSVAAYNMPGLVWLHLPALIAVDSPYLAIILTLLWVNMLGTFTVFALGKEVANVRVGMCAALIFAFSEASFSATTIAWAQLLLPSMFALVLLCLFRWRRTMHGAWMMAAGIVSVFAFMTHFSAILLFPICFLFWFVMHTKLHWRWLLATAMGAAILLAPYMMFQVGRDFRDVRAFLSRDIQIDKTTLQAVQVEVVRLGQSVDSEPLPTNEPQQEQSLIEAPPTPTRTFTDRLADYIGRLPSEGAYVSFRLSQFSAQFNPSTPPFFPVHHVLSFIAQIGWLTALVVALVGTIRVFRKQRWRTIWQGRAGKTLLLVGAPIVYVLMLLVLRVFPTEQPSYLTGLNAWVLVGSVIGLEWLLTRCIPQKRIVTVLLLGVVMISALFGSLTYTQRRAESKNLFPAAWYYTTLKQVAATIAKNTDGKTVTVAYDLWAQQQGFWWLPAWNTVDASYRSGMALDFILLAEYGITNTNTNAYGLTENADFVVRFVSDGMNQKSVMVNIQGVVLSKSIEGD